MSDIPAKVEPHSLAQPTPTAPASSVDILEIIRSQLLLITCCGMLGLLMAVIYWANAATWYETHAKMLITLKDMRGGEKGEKTWGDDGVQDEILANHIEIIQSRAIISKSLDDVKWQQMPGMVEQAENLTEAITYVADNLKMTKGGEGSARGARTLTIAFRHTDPEESLKVLQAIVAEYEGFLDEQVNRLMLRANRLIQQAQEKVEGDIRALEEQYVQARQNAPVLYSGEGSGNVYLDKFRRLQDELITVEIEISSVSTRLENVTNSIHEILKKEGDNTLELLALIDNDSLSRLGTFAGFSSAQTTDFQKNAAARAKEAEAKYSTLTSLRADLSKLEANFGPGHPQVVNLKQEIGLVEKLISESEKSTQDYSAIFEKLTPEVLLKAYVSFLRHDLSSLEERRRELNLLAEDVEAKTKSLIEFELKDKMIQGEITRKTTLFDGIVQQLRDMDTAAGLSGYMHEVLESPELGEKVWPSLQICAAGGLFLGCCLGLLIAIFNDQFDNRFRTPGEIDTIVGVPVIAQVGKINRSRDNRKRGRVIVDAQAPEAECFRLLRTYLLRDVRSGSVKTAMITSSQAKDGKSTILANLGASFAELGLSVVIIDGDMRAPTIHRFLNMPIDRGLSELLEGKAEIEEVLRDTGIDGLKVITAGSDVRNPAELLQDESFDKVLNGLKQRFDFVLVDSGPVLLVSDPAIVSQKCDISMLVVRPAIDTKRKVIEAARRLKSSRSNLRGCILNTYGSTKEFIRDSGYYANTNYYGYGYGSRGYGNRRNRDGDGSENGQRRPDNGRATSIGRS